MTRSAGPVAPRDLATEIARAERILRGTVTRVTRATGRVTLVSPDARPDLDELLEAEVAVILPLKGPHAPGRARVLFLQGRTPFRPWTRPGEGATVLLFLRSVDDAYVPVAPTAPQIRTIASMSAPPVGVAPHKAVAHELEQVILLADSRTEADLIVQAAQARLGLSADIDLAQLSRLPLSDPLRRAAWVSIAVAEGHFQLIPELVSLLDDASLYWVEALVAGVASPVSRIRDPAACPQLGQLVRHGRIELARAAAMALRQMHDRAALPHLIEALDHPDQDVRYQAAMGLAELEPRVDRGISFDLYRKNEPYYLGLWKSWWRRLHGMDT